jgi:DNA polymerase
MMSIAAGAVKEIARQVAFCMSTRPEVAFHPEQDGILGGHQFRFIMEMTKNGEDYARPAQPPDTSSLATVREAATHCTACHLYKRATQTVFGEGPKRAPMMLVGEQPGDYEDVAGKPFVGPAGKMMDRALEEAGIDRSRVYVTNAVKHFKWEPRGKRRIHQKPNSREIAACRPWLEAELRIVKPNLVVAMGATAAQAIFGPGFRVTRERGKVLSSKLAPRVLATVHPSSLLRQPDEQSREREYKHFVSDLRAAFRAAGEE